MKTLVGLIGLTILLLSTAVFGQNVFPALSEVNYNYYGAGARAFAMGDAFIGLADDITGGTWNPAGIWIIENPVMAATYFYYAPDGEYTHSLTPVVTENKLNVNALGSFSFATPLRIKGHPWVFNFNFNRNNQYTTEADLFSGRDSELNPDIFVIDQGHLKTFNVGLTTRLYKQLSVGFTTNVYDGRRCFKEVHNAAWDSTLVVMPPITLSMFQTVTRIDSTASNGVNFTVGMMYKMEKFGIGAVVNTPFTIKQSTDRISDTVVIAEGNLDINLSNTIFVNDSIAKQDMPLTLALGIAVFPNEKLSLTLDVNYRHYEDIKWYYRESYFFSAAGDRTDNYIRFPIDWNNSLGIGTGIEYLLDTRFGRVPLRGGLRFNQLPQPKTFEIANQTVLDEEGNPTDRIVTTYTASDRQNSMGISFGTGIHWSQIEFDFGYRYSTGAELVVSQFNDGSLFSEQKLERKVHEFRATFTGHF